MDSDTDSDQIDQDDIDAIQIPVIQPVMKAACLETIQEITQNIVCLPDRKPARFQILKKLEKNIYRDANGEIHWWKPREKKPIDIYGQRI